MKRPSIIAMAFFCSAVLLSGCSEQTASANKQPAKRVALDETLTSKFQASCANCHTVSAIGAPLKGDHEAWSEILDKPMAETMSRVINGYNGMPPLGQCFDCSESDLETLVLYLAQRD